MFPSFGPVLHAKGATFRLWAPLHERVQIRVADHPLRPMRRDAGGWFSLDVAGASDGMLYQFRLSDGTDVPDPALRFQPQDVHGPSQLVDLSAYPWRCSDWQGRPWEELVLYELHMGAFTAEGSFASAIDRLDHLKDLGVTAV